MGAAGVFGSIAQQVFAPVNNGFTPQTQFQQPSSGRFTQQTSASGQFAQQAPASGQFAQQPPVSGQFTQQAPANEAGQNVQEDPFEVLAKMKKMLDAGLISQAEYDAKKAEVLRRM